MVNFMFWPFCPLREPPMLIGYEAGGVLEPVLVQWQRKKYLPLPVAEPTVPHYTESVGN
jgi:hypothetical protein